MEKGDRTKETEEGRIGEIKKIREREREEDRGAAAQRLLQCAVIEERAVATGIITMCDATAATNRT